MENFNKRQNIQDTPPVAGSEVIKPETVSKINNSDEQYAEYWKTYANYPTAQRDIDDVLARNKYAAYLYKTMYGENEQRLNHIIWIYNKEDIPLCEIIPPQIWRDLSQKPEIIERVNSLIIESYNRVLDFYDWTSKPKGFVIESSKRFGMEAGNVRGIRLSYEGTLSPLIKAIEEKDEIKIKNEQEQIAASIAHEMTHAEKDEGILSQVKTEIASHIVQFIFNPTNNIIFNKELECSLQRIMENRNPKEGKDIKPLNLYDKAQYIALLTIAKELANYNESFCHILQNDKDPHKIETLRRLRDLIDVEDEQYLKAELLPKIMSTDDDRLMENLKAIETQLGIQRSILDIV